MKEVGKEYGYYLLEKEQVLERLKTSSAGLSQYEAQGRINDFGLNEITDKESNPAWKIFLNQFKSPLIIIVILAAIASFFIDHIADGIFIIFVVLINTTVGFFQENKAEKALEKLKKAVKLSSRVFRDGKKKQINSKFLVPGDIVEIREGDKVPADGRIIESQELEVEEAMLTGESFPVKKTSLAMKEEKKVSDQDNMVFMGTVIQRGKARFVITSTGSQTQIGKISKLVSRQKPTKTPLQKKFIKISKLLGGIVILAISIFALWGIYKGQDFSDIFVASVALVVSAIPSGMLPAITVILILGMRRISKKKALVRKLDSTEAIGATTVICFDKTGTLTQGKMRLSHILTGKKELLGENGDMDNIFSHTHEEAHLRILEIATLVNEAFVENPDDELGNWVIRGRPTDKALLMAGINAGIKEEKLKENMKTLKEIPFSSKTKFAVHFYEDQEKNVWVYSIGSPEKILEKSISLDLGEKIVSVKSKETEKILDRSQELASEGLRILACGWGKISQQKFNKTEDKLELVKNLNFLGFLAFKDPIRKGVQNSIEKAERAGIRPLVITGDHKNTAQAVVEELGMEVFSNRITEGKDLDDMSDKELEEKVKEISIFARVLPEHKIRIVNALKKNQEVVAMVGDGVNDAPALKAAHVGIAVGSGSDITKEVADVVLLNDSFSTIVSAIEQGRLIFENIRRVIVYLMADDFSELFLFFSAMFLGFPFPLYPVQILWINLIEDGFPDIALTTEKDTEGLMDEKPRDPKEPILNRQYKKFMLVIFLVSGSAALMLFLMGMKLYDLEKARTLAFALIAFDSLLFAYTIKSFKRSIFSMRTFSNKILNIALLVSLVLLFAAIYFRPLQEFLHTKALSFQDWFIVILVSLIEVLIFEIFKYIFFTSKTKKSP